MNRNRESARKRRFGCVAAWLLALAGIPSLAAAAPATGDPQPTLILAHYMPWFEAKPKSSRWGWHWTMGVRDPELTENGGRQIAAHYHPLIGPYDSGDPAVLEYQLLLMRLAGIDGVIVDWYGLSNHADYPILHRHTVLLENAVADAGMRFAVCYEDQTVTHLLAAGKLTASERVPQVRREIGWLNDNWFLRPNYVRFRDKPLLLSFGYSGLTDGEWASAIKSLPQPVAYVSEHFRRPCAAGAFDWPKPEQHPRSADDFHHRLPQLNPAIPVAFPRFHDFHRAAGIPGGHQRIEDGNGGTWTGTLERALLGKAPFVQLATWNDWGEGTQIEPSHEFGYRDLEALQRARRTHLDPGFRTTAADLRLPEKLLRLRQAGGPGITPRLDTVARMLFNGSVAEAAAILGRMDPAGKQVPDGSGP